MENMSYSDFWVHTAKLKYEARRRRIIMTIILGVLYVILLATLGWYGS